MTQKKNWNRKHFQLYSIISIISLTAFSATEINSSCMVFDAFVCMLSCISVSLSKIKRCNYVQVYHISPNEYNIKGSSTRFVLSAAPFCVYITIPLNNTIFFLSKPVVYFSNKSSTKKPTNPFSSFSSATGPSVVNTILKGSSLVKGLHSGMGVPSASGPFGLPVLTKFTQ